MEEPIVIKESPIPGKKIKENKDSEKTPMVKKKRLNGAALSYIIVLIAFAVGIIVCSIGTFDYDITWFFYSLGRNDLNGFWYKFGQFFEPFTILGIEPQYSWTTPAVAWSNLYIGQIFWEVLTILGGVMIIVPAIAYAIEFKKAKQENRKLKMPKSMKFLKFGLVVLVAALGIMLGIAELIKHIWGRYRPYALLALNSSDPYTNFTPWYVIPHHVGHDDVVSFFSAHASCGAMTTAVAFGFLGSKRKVLAYIFAILSVVYTILISISRMVSGNHFFSDILFGGFISYSFVLFEYYILWNIPSQENVERQQATYVPFNEGYKMILEGKALLEDNLDEATKKVSAGLEKLAEAKINAERITKNGLDFSQFIQRIDDLVARIGTLMQENPIDATKWTYFC